MRAVLASALVASALCAGGSARADPQQQQPARVSVGGGIGVFRLGGRRATGSRSAPHASLEVALAAVGRYGLLSYRNTLTAFGFADPTWLGVVDQNALVVAFAADRFRVAPGLAFELMTVPLCTDAGHCGRSTGIAPAAVLSLGATQRPGAGGVGALLTGSVRYVAAEPQPGWSFSAHVSGTYAW